MCRHVGVTQSGWMEVKQIDQLAASLREFKQRGVDEILLFNRVDTTFYIGLLIIEGDQCFV
jgi:hypothetical protein